MKDVEIFNDSFQNYKTYGIPHAQLILTDVPYVLGKTLMPPILLGTRMVTTKMEKASWLVSSSFLLTVSFDLPNLCTSVARCL